jgi:uncharacterized protein
VIGIGPQSFQKTLVHFVPLKDGDQIAIHDNIPETWMQGERTVLFIHGLAGDHSSTFVGRMALKFLGQGIRTFRIDLRCCGAAESLCSQPYHAGQSGDLESAVAKIAELCPGSGVTVIGISMGGNITLKLLGEMGLGKVGGVDSGVAICPPVDLKHTTDRRNWGNYFYEQYFLSLLYQKFVKLRKNMTYADKVGLKRRPMTVREHDEHFTAPLCQFDSADKYYEESSSCFVLKDIAVPTLIFAARDDPLVPPEPLEQADLSTSTELIMTDRGGHLGFLGRQNVDEDLRWVEWRVLEWVLEQCQQRNQEQQSSGGTSTS